MVSSQSRKIFQGVTDFFSEMNRMEDKVRGRDPEDTPRTEDNARAPLTDIHAEGQDLIIHCELPGVTMDEIDISYTSGVLTISGERETAAHSYYVQERFHGAFRRVIGLPEGVGDDDIHATLRQGLLVITVTGGATPSEAKKVQITGTSE